MYQKKSLKNIKKYNLPPAKKCDLEADRKILHEALFLFFFGFMFLLFGFLPTKKCDLGEDKKMQKPRGE